MRYYSSTAVATTLTGALSSGGGSATVGSTSGFPTSFPWTAVLDAGTLSEELVDVTNMVGLVLTVTRGADGTSAIAHSAGATLRHAGTGRDLREPQEHIAASTAVHGLTGAVVGTTDSQTLTNKTLTSPTLTTPVIGSYVSATHDHSAAASGGNLPSSSVTGLVAALALLVPGIISPYAGAAAPTGWLLCDGAAVNRTTYASLFAVTGTTYGVGDGSTTFNLPNLKGKVPVGIDSGQTEFDVRGETGGAKTSTLLETNLPPHAHAIDHDHGSATSGAGSAHAHSIDAQYQANTNNTGSAIRISDIENMAGGAGTGILPVGNTEAAHTHPVDLPNYVGSSGNGLGASTPVNVLQPYMALNYIVKT